MAQAVFFDYYLYVLKMYFPQPLVSSQPGQLNPVGSGLGGGVGPLMGLPPLKLAPLKTATLAPVRPPPGMVGNITEKRQVYVSIKISFSFIHTDATYC